MSNDKVMDKLDALIGMVKGVDTRLDRLEADVSDLKADVKELKGDVNSLGKGLARLEGRVEEQSQILQVAIAGRITRSKPAA